MKIQLRSSTADITSLIVILFAAIILSGCQRYSVSVNERVVYTPPGLFSDYSIEDENLRTCIASIIEEEGFVKARQIKRIICGPKNIANLAGIEAFTYIEVLGLADNKISNIEPVSSLIRLKQLDVSNNEVEDFSPLAELASLQTVSALGNKQAKCNSIMALKKSLSTKNNANLSLPEHCQ